MAARESGKLVKARRRGYVRVGEVKSLNQHFSVPKGDDIRMVYNGTSSGLNNSL